MVGNVQHKRRDDNTECSMTSSPSFRNDHRRTGLQTQLCYHTLKWCLMVHERNINIVTFCGINRYENILSPECICFHIPPPDDPVTSALEKFVTDQGANMIFQRSRCFQTVSSSGAPRRCGSLGRPIISSATLSHPEYLIKAALTSNISVRILMIIIYLSNTYILTFSLT